MTIRGNKIVLVGFMGTGKSTVAALLAARLGVAQIDLDERIEAAAGCTIAEMFARRGEAAFREAETETLREVLAGERAAVVATGGGAVLSETNRRLMLAAGRVVALTAQAARIIERVKGDGARPLLAGDIESRVGRLLAERAHAYDFAHLSIDTTDRTPAEVTETIARWMEEAG